MEPNEMGCCILDIDYINKTPKVLQFFCSDRKGLKVTVLFFHMDYLATQFQKGDKVLVCGILKTDEHNASQRSIFNPLIFTKEIEKYKGIHPIYSAIKGMSSEFLEEAVAYPKESISVEVGTKNIMSVNVPEMTFRRQLQDDEGSRHYRCPHR